MTIAEILVSIRELSYDRYPIPVFVLKAQQGKAVTNNNSSFNVHPLGVPSPPDYTYGYNPDGAADKLQNLISGLIGNNYPVAMTGYYYGQDAPNSLLLATNNDLVRNTTYFRRFFLSDIRVQQIMVDYHYRILCHKDTTMLTLADDVALMNDYTTRHMILWCAIKLVDMRRIAELAQSAIGSMSFSDGTGVIAGTGIDAPGLSVQVNIGSVFTLSDDNSVTAGYFQEDFNRIGSDNVLGDKESFWFKLWLSLRAQLESDYQDYYFRESNAMNSQIILERPLNYFSYFDSWPYTWSPYSRNILD